MNDKINSVKEFHKVFNLDFLEAPKANIGLEKNKLRFNLMKEENEEYLNAANNNDLIEVADALGDMLYILCGTIIEHGFQYKIDEIFNANYEYPVGCLFVFRQVRLLKFWQMSSRCYLVRNTHSYIGTLLFHLQQPQFQLQIFLLNLLF